MPLVESQGRFIANIHADANLTGSEISCLSDGKPNQIVAEPSSSGRGKQPEIADFHRLGIRIGLQQETPTGSVEPFSRLIWARKTWSRSGLPCNPSRISLVDRVPFSSGQSRLPS